MKEVYWSKVGVWIHNTLSEEDRQLFLSSLGNRGRWTEVLHYISAQSHSEEHRIPASFAMSMLELAISDSNTQVDWQHLGHDVPRLLKVIEASKEIDDERLGRLEILFLPLLEYSEYQPKALMRGLNENPVFFCDLVKIVFRAEGEEPRQLSPEENIQNDRAYELLRLWRTLPGSNEKGDIDAEKLSVWVAKAVELVNDCGRGDIGEQQVGQLLSHSPVGSDNSWPHESVRQVIEQVASAELEQGFEVGTFNNRGVTSRGLTDGGIQEQGIATRYSDDARKFRDDWPRTSRMLIRMADQYRGYARREDISADLTQDLWR